ncbi:hypothetical protein B0H14DRAFT_2631628 [Mycena olivaceomarginata]|nr:hypothetical protein B0H14DRAFT_2631628 [Mycena olivaceomarginata]
MNEVLPYYALKRCRQELGFEGVDIEVKKWQDILKHSQVYEKEDIRALGDSKYIVPSKLTPSKVYEIDIDTYTCTCPDYSLISFYKHIGTVQDLFKEDKNDSTDTMDANKAPTASASPQVPVLSSLPETDSDSCSVLPLAPVAMKAASASVLSTVTEKLECLVAHLCMPRMKTKTDTLCFDELQEALDKMLRRTDNGSVLPSAKLFAPVIKPSTTRQMTLPKAKTWRIRAGDPAYGAGASSGSLAKSSTKKAKMMDPPHIPLPPMPSTAPAVIPSPSAPTPPLGYYQFYSHNLHFYSYPATPAPVQITYPYPHHSL